MATETISTQIARIELAKQDIIDAIASLGVIVPEGTRIDGLANLIKSIGGTTGSDLEKATATPSDVLTGKTFFAGNNVLKTGAIEIYQGDTEIYQGDQGEISE